MINIKKLLICIVLPLLAGVVGYFLGGDTNIYGSIIKPSFSPPAFIFPIVWTILYVLMGVSCYIIKMTDSKYQSSALTIYYIQLAVNTIWSLLFFRFNAFFISFLWIILLIVLVAYMIYLFFKVNPKAAYLQIPYLLWLIFASILNFSVFYLNRA